MTKLTDIVKNRKPPEALLTDLLSERPSISQEAGKMLVNQAKEAGLGLRDYLTLSVDPTKSDHKERYKDVNGGFLNGYEASLAFLNLPIRNDYENGIVLQAAGETFQTYTGTRALFPEVIDDMVKWKYRQTSFEQVAPLVAQSRTVSGVEIISTVVDDQAADYKTTAPIAEMARIPVRSIRSTENSVKFYKHGSGYRVSYEFLRRAGLDFLTPYAARTLRELEINKVAAATLMLINGDGVHSAAGTVNQSTLDPSATAGTISYKGLLKWLVNRAKVGTPVDTVVGNWDAYVQWLMLFSVPSTDKNRVDAENLAAAGFQIGGVPILQGTVNFALSSQAPANQLIGFSRADTMEELVESGSLINESEQAVSNQTISYFRTENTGYRLVFGDTRSIYVFDA